MKYIGAAIITTLFFVVGHIFYFIWHFRVSNITWMDVMKNVKEWYRSEPGYRDDMF
jgi:hypothetical protein